MNLGAFIGRRGFLAVAICLIAVSAAAGDLGLFAVPAAQQVEILKNVLAFDKARSGTLTVGVLHQPSNRNSVYAARSILDAAAERPGSVIWIAVAINREEDLEALLASGRVDALYIAPLQAVDLRVIESIARRLSILTMTGVSAYEVRTASIAIARFRNKPKIIIDLERSRGEGSDLSSRLLSIAEVKN